MRKVWYIIQREYLSRVRKRSFILLTLLLPVLVGVFTVVMVKNDKDRYLTTYQHLLFDNVEECLQYFTNKIYLI